MINIFILSNKLSLDTSRHCFAKRLGGWLSGLREYDNESEGSDSR